MLRNERQPGLLAQYAHLSQGRRANDYGRKSDRPKVEPIVQGTIRRLMSDRGFGFVQTEGVREDIFFHRSSVQDTSFEELKEGDLVDFEMQSNPRAGRTCAVNVRPSTRPRSEARPKPLGRPHTPRSRGRIFTGWREDLDRMEQQEELRRNRAEAADAATQANAAARKAREGAPAHNQD